MLNFNGFSGGSRISRMGGVDLVGGRGLPRQLRFENFACQKERISTLRGACAAHAPSRSANGFLQSNISISNIIGGRGGLRYPYKD